MGTPNGEGARSPSPALSSSERERLAAEEKKHASREDQGNDGGTDKIISPPPSGEEKKTRNRPSKPTASKPEGESATVRRVASKKPEGETVTVSSEEFSGMMKMMNNLMDEKYNKCEKKLEQGGKADESDIGADRVSALAALGSAGLSSLDLMVIPNPKEIIYVRNLIEQVRKSSGSPKPFVFVDVKTRVFLPESAGKPHSAPSVFKDGRDHLAVFANEFEYVKENSRDESFNVQICHLLNFLFKQYMLSQITGFCDSCGGSSAFLSYIIALFHYTAGEKTSTVVQCDRLLRSHFAKLSSAGHPFNVGAEIAKNIDHFLLRARSDMDKFFNEKRVEAAAGGVPGKGQQNRASPYKTYYQYGSGVNTNPGFAGSYSSSSQGDASQFPYGPIYHRPSGKPHSKYSGAKPSQKGGRPYKY